MQSFISCLSSLVCSETLFQASQLCLASINNSRSLDLSFPRVSGSSALAPGHSSCRPAAAAARCCHACFPRRSTGGGKGPWEIVAGSISLLSSSYTPQTLRQSSHLWCPSMCQAITPESRDIPWRPSGETVAPLCLSFSLPTQKWAGKCGHHVKMPLSHALAPLRTGSGGCTWSASPKFMRPWVRFY